MILSESFDAVAFARKRHSVNFIRNPVNHYPVAAKAFVWVIISVAMEEVAWSGLVYPFPARAGILVAGCSWPVRTNLKFRFIHNFAFY